MGNATLNRRLRQAKEFASLTFKARSPSIAKRIWKIAADATKIPGWVEGAAAREVAAESFFLEGNPTIVEVGVFMGRSTVLLASARRARGSGTIYCVDPFDGSGDDFSMPVYQGELYRAGAQNLEEVFRRNIAARDLDPWVTVLKGKSDVIVGRWRQPIDLLLLDGDHSPDGAQAIFSAWSPLIRAGGRIILHNTGERAYADGHDGNYRIAISNLTRLPFSDLKQIDYTSYARRGNG